VNWNFSKKGLLGSIKMRFFGDVGMSWVSLCARSHDAVQVVVVSTINFIGIMY
jgi:hypothetical protein